MSLLTAQGITKRYGGVIALDDVSLELNAGEVLGLLGANGSGKSTLSSVLAGDNRPERGTLALDGVELAAGSPRAARAAGIAIAHQHPGLAPDLPVWENVFLGAEVCKAGRFLDQASARRRAGELLSSLRPGWDPDAPATSLNAADQQLVEIAKALALEPRSRQSDTRDSRIGRARYRDRVHLASDGGNRSAVRSRAGVVQRTARW